MRKAALLFFILVLACSFSLAGTLPVKVELAENTSTNLTGTSGLVTESFNLPAFGFVGFPTKYSDKGIPLDRSNPFRLSASAVLRLPRGRYEFRLRAKGLAQFFIDDAVVLETEPQKGNTSGHDAVPPEADRTGSPLRPPPYPHEDRTFTVELDGATHRFSLIALIGGKGLAPTPGELSVSVVSGRGTPRLLGLADSPLLTDAGWEQFAATQQEWLRQRDQVRRREAASKTAAAWDAYHHALQQRLTEKTFSKPPHFPPNHSSGTPVDAFIDAKLDEARVHRSASINDLEYLRRLSLDLIGLIPTEEEVQAFLKDPPRSRRKKAVERLLAHPGWADHWVSYWQDVLAENPGILKPDLNNSGPFRWWLHQSFEDNLPFDRLVAELVEMEGSEYLGAPAAFKKASLNDSPMAAKADIIAQAFLGEKLSCARCHDAPFHPWTQKNLFGLGAMLEGKGLKLPGSSTVPIVDGFRKPKVQVSLRAGDIIEPAWPFEKLVPDEDRLILPSLSSVPTRNRAAALIVSPDNARFPQVIVNRIWKRYLGSGLVEPVEDWNEATPSHPELLDYLSHVFVSSGYDLKQLTRLIVSTHLYQRQPLPSTEAKNDRKLFPGPIRRRMSAEQLVDSAFRSVGKDFASEELNLNPAGNRPLSEFLDLGRPSRAWEFTALSNERDRPALALPVTQSIVDVLCAFGWRQSRQTPITQREDSPSPMQTLLLANGTMGTRITRLSDDSAFTGLALKAKSVNELVHQAFIRILSRPPSKAELQTARELLQPVFANRVRSATLQAKTNLAADQRVTWGNHLSSEATLIRMEEERRLRLGDAPTHRLSPEFRERFEDLLWSLLNSPEFTLIP